MSTAVEAPNPFALKQQAAKKDIKSLLEGDKFQQAVAKVLPEHCKPERFIRVALTATMRTPLLLQCDQESFFQALLNLSQWGLEPDGRRAHLIPFKNNKRNCYEVQLIIDYKGLVELALRSGNVSYIHADIVCENDVFEYDRGAVKAHKVDFKRDRGEMYAAYALCRFKDGSEQCAVMSKPEIDAIRARSRAGNSGPWNSDYNEMAKKGLALDTAVPTPDGWTTMGEIKAGETVFDMHGQPTKVMAVSEIKHIDCYKVTFQNGDSIVCDGEHLWLALIGSNAAAKRKLTGWETYEIGDMFAAKNSLEPITIPVVDPLELPERDLLIDPWLLGYWLGNGNRNAASITCHEGDVSEVSKRIQRTKYKLGVVRHNGRSKAVRIGIKGGFLDDLRAIGVISNKHVPGCYLRASKAQRYELLCGLMDSDGHIDKSRGRAMFGSTLECLTDAVFELAVSLGEVVFKNSRMAKGFGKEVLFFNVGWKPRIAPCSLPRKLANFTERKLSIYRAVKAIDRVPSVPTRCIAVESETRTYLVGRSMVPTHNTTFRRLSKWLNLSAEFRDALDADADSLEDTRLEAMKPARAVAPEGLEIAQLPESAPEPEAPTCAPEAYTPEITPLDKLRDAMSEDSVTTLELLAFCHRKKLTASALEKLEQLPHSVINDLLSGWNIVGEEISKGRKK